MLNNTTTNEILARNPLSVTALCNAVADLHRDHIKKFPDDTYHLDVGKNGFMQLLSDPQFQIVYGSSTTRSQPLKLLGMTIIELDECKSYAILAGLNSKINIPHRL